MGRYYKASIDNDVIKVFCHSCDGDKHLEITDPVIISKVIGFALQQPSEKDGSRILKEGQAKVIDSLLNIELVEKSEKEQHLWEQAAIRTLSIEKKKLEGQERHSNEESSSENTAKIIPFKRK